MKTETVEFYECEHEGDLDRYVDDLLASGFSVSDSSVCEDAEIGSVTVSAPEAEWDKCSAKFQKTSSHAFLN